MTAALWETMSTGMRRVLLTSRLCLSAIIRNAQLTYSAERKATTTSPASQSMPPPKQVSTPAIDCNFLTSHQTAPENTKSVSPYLNIDAASIKRETPHPTIESRVKSEPRSQSPSKAVASTMSPSAKTAKSLISSMVDTTAYVPAPAKSPSAPLDTTTSDQQLFQRLVADAATFPIPTAEIEISDNLQQSENFSLLDPAFVTTPTPNPEERHAQQDDAVTANAAEVAPLPSDLPPTDTGASQRRGSGVRSSSSRTSQPRRNRRSSVTSDLPNPSNAKPSTPNSLYPGTSATMPPPDLNSNNISAKKRSRLARSEHPERFLYAGNTFSNLDERSFHETAENNPYLHQLTSSATRPVYKTPLEARQALKEVENPVEPVIPPVDYDQQIKELTDTIAEFRKKYEKSKVMTAQAGIQVEDNVWDRLSNIVQYPPDFAAYARKGKDLSEFAEEVKAWDRAIGHQVIIKKRVVYREALDQTGHIADGEGFGFTQ